MENLIILSVLVAHSHQTPPRFTIPQYTALSPSSLVHIKVTNAVQPLLSNCQCIVITSCSQQRFTPGLARQIIERAVHLERPLEIHSFSLTFQFQNYNGSKHGGVELVFLYVAPVWPSNGVLHWELPMIFQGNRFRAHMFPYLMVYLVDDSYLKGTTWYDTENDRACHVLQNTVYLQFWSLQPDLPLRNYALQYRCDGSPFCMPELESKTADGLLFYESVIEELRIRRNNFHGYRVVVKCREDEFKTWAEITAMYSDPYITFHDGNIPGTYASVVPVYHLAQALNFSMNFLAEWSADPEECNVGSVQFNARAKGGDFCVPGFLESQLQDFLLQASQVEDNSPLTFASILGPMKWNVWLLLGLVTLLVWVLAALKTHRMEEYIWLLAIVAYYCGQYLEPRMATRLWCTFWVVVMFFVSNYYSGELQSLQIVPPIELKNMSFDGLNEKNSTYFASYDTYLTYLGYRDSAPFTAFMSEKALRLLSHVASVMQLTPYHLPTADLRQAMKNTSVVWLAREHEVQAYCEVFIHQLGVGCQKLKFEFLAVTCWTMMGVPHGDMLVEKYGFLTDAGMVQYWDSKGREEMRADWKGRFLKTLHFSDDKENYVVEFVSVGFSDSVLKESFYLYALGVVISLVVIWVEMMHTVLEFHWETV